jgi:hypothetical protein
MELIDVTARFGEDGKVIPLSFRWQGREYRVTSWGRQWHARDGQHFLVMAADQRVRHLLFAPEKAGWYLIRVGEISVARRV